MPFFAKTLGEQTNSKFFLKLWGSNCSPAPASAPHGIDLRLLTIKPTYIFKARYVYVSAFSFHRDMRSTRTRSSSDSWRRLAERTRACVSSTPNTSRTARKRTSSRGSTDLMSNQPGTIRYPTATNLNAKQWTVRFKRALLTCACQN